MVEPMDGWCCFRHKFCDGFEGRSFLNVAEKDIIYPLRKASFLKLEIGIYFSELKNERQ